MNPQSDNASESPFSALNLSWKNKTANDSVTGSNVAIIIPDNNDEAQKITPIAPKKKNCQKRAVTDRIT